MELGVESGHHHRMTKRAKQQPGSGGGCTNKTVEEKETGRKRGTPTRMDSWRSQMDGWQ